VTVPLEDRVKRIDPATNAIAEVVRVGGGPAAVALGAAALWVASHRAGTVTRIDPRQASITAMIRLGDSPQGIAVAGGVVWVTVQAGAPATAPVERADVLRVHGPGFLEGIDPARLLVDQYQYATCASLLNYPDRPFPEGAQRRPEVAAAMRAMSDGGRTYTFRLRPGFHFSPPSGAPVTAAAFQRALERLLHPTRNPELGLLMIDIAGARA
jgi:ABC-type transport system substrate-binding protein